MKETYIIDDDVAYEDFVKYLSEEKPEKTFKKDKIEFPDFFIEVTSNYKDKVDKLFSDELDTFKFDIKGLQTEVIENQGYNFTTFKGI